VGAGHYLVCAPRLEKRKENEKIVYTPMEENKKERYEAPEIVVVKIKMDRRILQGSADIPGFGDENDF
jgi:hypothetical protein